MPQGGVIGISTETLMLADQQVGTLPAGQYVCVAVSDTGSGMPQDVAKRAVEPFFTTKDVGKGTGLGLSQVYGFINQSGGDLVITSDIEKGTSISMYLPGSEDESPEIGRAHV